MNKIHFWNGNKSLIRQRYEREILEACLNITSHDHSDIHLVTDDTDYPSAEDEGNIFSKNIDALITVAGNQKFSGKEFHAIHSPIAKGLLGYRVLITRKEMLGSFAHCTTEQQCRNFKAGIPATWADADLFRFNQYPVVEKGLFEEIFIRLKNAEFDYVSLGANEVESVFESMAKPLSGLVIEPSLALQYPFPLVFYVHPDKRELAERISSGLEKLYASGKLDSIFNRYFAQCINSLNLASRNIIPLHNPILPEALIGNRHMTLF